jgi:hypothetical protein
MIEGPASIAVVPNRARESCMKSAVPLIVVTALASITFAAQEPQQQPTFRSGAKTVAVYATVTDKDGRVRGP